MKKCFVKPIAAAVCAVVLAGGAGSAVYARSSVKNETEVRGAGYSAPAAGTEKNELTKDETVYVLAQADGSVRKIIVSDWIKNTLGSDSIRDDSSLTGVENVKGDETYTVGGDGARVWDAQGNDIYYQGSIEKELPVSLSVSYRLNGQSISPAELAGKSGRVTIRFDYKNNQYETVEIDGKQEKIYVPFVMLTGVLLDNEIFSDVTVSGGKLINDGSRTVVAGIAFPGLQSNLNMNAEKLEIPDFVEISAEVKGFEMMNTVTIAVNDIFSRVDTEKLNFSQDLTGSLEELTDAVNQLIDGSSQLYGGLCTLLEKSEELVAGIDKLAAGAGALKQGAGELAGGLGKLDDNSDALNNGALRVYESLLSAVNKQIAETGIPVAKLTVKNYRSVLTGLLQNPNAAQKQQMTAIADAQLEAQLAAAGVPQTQYQAVKYMLYQRLAAGQTTETAMNEIGALMADAAVYIGAPTALPAYEALYQAVCAQYPDRAAAERITSVAVYLAGVKGGEAQQYLSAAGKIAQHAKEVSDAANAAESEQGKAAIGGLCFSLAKQTLEPQIQSALEQLDSYGLFYAGLSEYTAGVGTAKSGAEQLYAGASELYNGILTLKNGAPALVGGVTELRDGAFKLSGGLKEFDEKGVKKLIDAVDGDLAGLITRIKATVDVSKGYQNFSGMSGDMDGQVKFIYRTDSVKIGK